MSVIFSAPDSRFAVSGPAVVLLLSSLTACHKDSASQPDDALARIGDVSITVPEFDAHVRSRPPAKQAPPDEDRDLWLRDQLRELALDRWFAQQGRESGIAEGVAFADARQRTRAALELQYCVPLVVAAPTPPSEDDLRAEFEARAASLNQPERRLVSNIFLRAAPGAEQLAEQLRDRLLRGDSMRNLAREHSQSETRHRGGELGWIARGSGLDPALEEAIFGLEEGIPSRPLWTAAGWHVLRVDRILPARQPSFDEVREALADALVAREVNASIRALLEDVPIPEGSFRLEGDQLRQALESREADRVLLRHGEAELTLGDLSELAQQVQEQSSTTPPPRPVALIEQRWQSERLLHHCRTTGLLTDAQPEIDRRIAQWEEASLAREARTRQLTDLARRDEDSLREHYRSNISNFSRPERWRLRRLVVPVNKGVRRAVSRLEEEAPGGQTALDQLASELGASVEDLPMQSAAELKQRWPALPGLLARLGAGERTAPFRNTGPVEMFEVVEHDPSTPRPFEEIVESVARSYAQLRRADLYRQRVDEILDEHPLLIDEVALLGYASEDPAQISIEELERQFEQLDSAGLEVNEP